MNKPELGDIHVSQSYGDTIHELMLHVPAFFRTSGIAIDGPIPIMSGGHPTTAQALRTPRTGRSHARATDLLATSTAAAPSLTWLELPVVIIKKSH